MASNRPRPWLAGIPFTFAAIALLLCLAANATASTGGAPTAAGAPAASGSPTGDAGERSPQCRHPQPRLRPDRAAQILLLRLPLSERALLDRQHPGSRTTCRSTSINSAGEVARSFYRNDVEPNAEVRIRWDGTTSEGRPARNGRYSFRIEPQGGSEVAARATTSSEPLNLGFALYGYAFPILGPHEFGGAAGRFGAGRSGHTHQGQDTMADCGTPLVAARGGTVQYAGYQYAAGNYVVIDGKGTTLDFMYAHLAEPSPLKTGDQVRTGQPIGIVGDTGDATACHLHFEIWDSTGLV